MELLLLIQLLTAAPDVPRQAPTNLTVIEQRLPGLDLKRGIKIIVPRKTKILYNAEKR